MKKTILGFLAAASLTFTMTSCGEKLLTPEQVNAKIEEGVNAQKTAVQTEAAAACDARFESAVTGEVDRMKAEDDARIAAEKEAAAAAKKK